VSAETMAGFRQGGLSPRKNSRISAHLAGCDRCRTLDEDLAGVRTLLAGAQPPPIPEHLAARIQTALATEAASRVVRPAGSENGIGVPGPGRPARGPGWLPHRPGMPRLGSRVALGSLAAAAAVLVVIGGMYMFGSRGTGSGPSGTVAGAPAHRPAGQSAGSEIGVPGPGPGGQPLSGPALRYRHSGHEDRVTPVTTDMDFTPGRLRTQVAAAVASYGTKTTRAAPNTNPLSGVISPAAAKPSAMFGNIPLSLLQGCVNRIDAGELVLLVDVARYRGTPATVIVTEMTAIGPEQIWVVGPGCSGSHTDMLTHATMAAP